MGTTKTILKKVLIMPFDDSYIRPISRILLNKEMSIIPELGFANYEDKDKKILFTFLSSKIRRTWIHHFTGTYGIILIYEGEDTDKNLKEVESLFSCPSLNRVPIVLIFDKRFQDIKDEKYINEFIEMLRKLGFKLFIININFDNINSGQKDFLEGTKWMEKEMDMLSIMQ